MRYVLMTLLALLALLASGRAEERDEAVDPRAEADAIVKRLGADDADERIEALRAAAENQHKSLLSPLTRLLKDKNPAVRIAAIEALGLRKVSVDQKRAASALCARIKPLEARAEAATGGEEARKELLQVFGALHDLAQPVAIRSLLANLASDTDRELLRARLRAAANIPDKEVVDRLIQYASSGRRGSRARRDVARDALRYATQENLRGNVEEWRKWWRENKSTFDVHAAAAKRAEQRQQEATKANRKRERKGRRKKPDSD